MRVSMPRWASAATIRSTGQTSAVADVMWLNQARRVRGPAAAVIAATTSSDELTGTGTRATTRLAPASRATARAAFWQALYSWLVVRISSPGWSEIERSTVLTPVVALGTKATSIGRAPRNAASGAR